MIDASSLPVATIEYIGCIATLLILPLCPCNKNFSGALGKTSNTEFYVPPAPPEPELDPHLSHIYDSLSYFTYLVRSSNYFYSLPTVVHFYSNMSFFPPYPLPDTLSPSS